MDAILAIVPWKIVWKLSMNKREKAGEYLASSFEAMPRAEPSKSNGQ